MKTPEIRTKILCGIAAAVCSTTLLFGPAAAHADPAADAVTLNSVHAALERGKRPPTGRDASLQQPTGTVTLEFRLTKSGAVNGVVLEQTSGSQILDVQAEALVRRAHYAPFAEHAFDDAETHRFAVSYVFERPADGAVSVGPLRVVQR